MKVLFIGGLVFNCLVFLPFFVHAQGIHTAVQASDIAEVNRIAKEDPSQLEVKNEAGLSPVNLAAVLGNSEMFNVLINLGSDLLSGDNEGSCAIHNAAFNGHLNIVSRCLEKGIDVNLKDSFDVTPLHFAAFGGHSELIRFLLSKGANVNAVASHGATPLKNSLMRRSVESALILLDANPDINIFDRQSGYKPIHYASALDLLPIIDRLIQMGANLNENSEEGCSPLLAAVRNSRIEATRHLIELGADIDKSDNYGFNPILAAAQSNEMEILHLLLERGANPNSRDINQRTPLQIASTNGNLQMISELIGKGAKVNKINSEGKTALYFAASAGQKDALELLLKSKARLNPIETNRNWTPMHAASAYGYGDVVELLLENKADFRSLDALGHSALFYAINHGNYQIADALRKAGAKLDDGESKIPNRINFEKKYTEREIGMVYSNHCGWILKTQNHVLIIDYFQPSRAPDQPSILNGFAVADELKNLPVTVLVTHEHRDHFSEDIFRWESVFSNIQYVFGFEPEKLPQYRNTPYPGPRYTYIGPRESKGMGDMKIHTIQSIDSGVGFLIEVDGLTIFHAGDHAGWLDGEKSKFTQEIDYLTTMVNNIDIAFVNVTGCHTHGEEQLVQSVRYIVEKLKPKVLIPTHGGMHREHVYKTFQEKLKQNSYATRYLFPDNPGDYFALKFNI